MVWRFVLHAEIAVCWVYELLYADVLLSLTDAKQLSVIDACYDRGSTFV